jgi:tRNA(Arg) A34 adenosine deaminase TadA
MTPFREQDVNHLRRAIELAGQARERGDNPFGAVLVDEDGTILAEGQNTERDVTGHAETNLLREACRLYDPRTLAASTLYSSGEPCAMCSGTIFWSGVGRVVYGMSSDRLYELFPPSEANPVLRVPCREVLSAGTRATEVVGPILEQEAERVYERSAGP